jgi:ABC-type uncharacterized transport system substrate-binding protein
MKRREFMALLGGAAASWPLVARAQQPERMRRIGVLMPAAADDRDAQDRIAALLQGLQQLGWTVGRNMRMENRWATTNMDAIRKHAAELVALAPDVIVANGAAAVGPLMALTRTIPIVFGTVGDPVGLGFARSLARPGGNVTGFALYEFGLAWSSSRRLRRARRGWPSSGMPRCRSGSPSLRQSCRSRRRSGWN